MSNKPVAVRVAEKIASALFDDEERGYLFLALNQEKQAAAPVEEAPNFDPQLFKESLKLASENPALLRDIYAKTASELSPEAVQAIEKQAQADVVALKEADENFKKAEFYRGVLQYQGFKYAAAQDEANQQTNQTAKTASQQAPHLARAAGLA